MLRAHCEEVSSGRHPDRDAQFLYIRSQRQIFSRSGNPVVSVDTKKKELVGRFKNPGQVWSREAIPVNDHDLRSRADGFAIPYGLCDLQNNLGVFSWGPPTTPQISPLMRLSPGGMARDRRCMKANQRFSFSPTAAAATARAAEHGSSSCRKNCVMALGYRSPLATILRVHPSGIPWSIDSSARSPNTGRDIRSIASRPSSTISGPPKPRQGSESQQLSRTRRTKPASRSPRTRGTDSAFSRTTPSPSGTTPYNPQECDFVFAWAHRIFAVELSTDGPATPAVDNASELGYRGNIQTQCTGPACAQLSPCVRCASRLQFGWLFRGPHRVAARARVLILLFPVFFWSLP